jgi:hypothetical protein
MNPMAMMGGGGGMPGMPPAPVPGSSQLQSSPGPMDMQALLAMLQNPMGAAAGAASPPMDPAMQAILQMLTRGGAQPPTTGQVPGQMGMAQMLAMLMAGGGAGGAVPPPGPAMMPPGAMPGGGMGGPPMGGMPPMRPGY